MQAAPQPRPILPPIHVGPVTLPGVCLLAPMSGVTDAPFRRIVQELGRATVVSEMIASERLVAGEAEAMLKLEGRGVRPNIVQLAGCEAVWLAEAARVAEASGADVIDINMGCPAKRVVNGWAGSALMRDLDHATSLIAATVAAVRVPVTLKMRLGWDRATMNAPELARRAAGEGVKLVTVHGRTRDQFYTGSADWAAVRAVREAVDLPLVVNGDIGCAATATKALALSGADAIMVGRAAVGRPWLPGQLSRWLAGEIAAPADPDIATQRAIALRHLEESLEHYGPGLGLRMVRKHLAGALDAAHGGSTPEATRQAVLAEPDVARARDQLARVFDQLDLPRAA